MWKPGVVVVASVLGMACRPSTGVGYLTPPPVRDGAVRLGATGVAIAAALRAEYRGQVARVAPPFALTADDGDAGSPFELRRIDARIAIRGPLAHTELALHYVNSAPRARNARFAIALPVGAVLAHLGGRPDDPRARPRLADALGEPVSTRIALAAGGEQIVRVAYDHVVSSARPYVLPLDGLPAVPAIAISIDHDGAQRTIARAQALPADIAIEPAAAASAAGAGELVVASVPLPADASADGLADATAAPLDATMILVDTSASRAQVMGRQLGAVRALLRELPGDARIVLATFDHGVDEVFRGRAADAGDSLDAILEHGALGGSDLGGALARAAASGMHRVIVIGDGVPTLGERDPGALASAVQRSQLMRVDALPIGPADPALRAIVAAGRVPGALLDVRDASWPAQLARVVPAARSVRVAGAAASWPATTAGTPAGSPIVIVARRRGPGPLLVELGDRVVAIAVRPAPSAAVTAVAAHIAPTTAVPELAAAALPADALDADPTPPAASRPRVGEIFHITGRVPRGKKRVRTVAATTRPFETRVRDARAGWFAPLIWGRVPMVGSGLSSAPAVDEPAPPAPYIGRFAEVMAALAEGRSNTALSLSTGWQLRAPGDLAALIALGEALEARGSGALAARAYGSLLDLYPGRADVLRAAGQRLDRIARQVPAVHALAIDAYRRALRVRPDQLTTYRQLAWALWRAGRGEEAIDVLGVGLETARRPSVSRVLAEDAGLIAAHISARDPARAGWLAPRMMRGIPERPSVRVVLSWESDDTDVDLHIRDRHGNLARFDSRVLASGGELLEDITDGFGPELFVVDAPRAAPYEIAAQAYERGPLGIGLGSVQVIRHDGAGNLVVDDRPFVIQQDGATLGLGTAR